MTEKEILAKLKQGGDIPSLPSIVQKVNKAVASDTCTAEELGHIIEQDQALSTKLLRLANSSYYGLSRKVNTISRAITVLGFNMVRDLALTVSVYKIFSSGHGKGGVDVLGLWAHSFACAIASKVLMTKRFPEEASRAFLGGILHDIGKVLILQKLPQEQAEIKNRLHSDSGVNLIDAEREVLGFTHAEVGALVSDMWQFPKDLIEPIQYHHAPRAARISPVLVAAVHVGNEVVKAIALGKSTALHVMAIDENMWDTLHIQAPDLPNIVANIYNDFELAADFIEA